VLTFSYPLIGNYGVRDERFESGTVQPRAAIAREMTDEVAAWLESEAVPAIDHLDTREVVTTVREEYRGRRRRHARRRDRRDGGV
jgi:carbamoyl-phosphate synthase small subunit